MNFLSRFASRAAALLIPALAAALMLAYAEGYISLPLPEEEMPLPVPSSPLADGEEVSTSAAPSDTELPQETTAALSVRPDSVRTAITKDEILALSAHCSFIPTDVPSLAAVGLSRSYSTFSFDTTVLGLAGGFDFLPTKFSVLDGNRTVLSYVRPDEQSAPEPIYEDYPAALPAVQLYMGLIILDDGTEMKIYNADGVHLLSCAHGAVSLPYTRDKSGNPLFRAAVETESGKWETAYFTAEIGGFVLSDYDDETEGRGLYFDYPPDFGLTDNTVIRHAQRTDSGTKWAFGYRSGSRMTSYKYYGAFDFSEGLAAVIDAKGHLYYVGRWGYQEYQTERNFYYLDRYVIEYLLPPLTAGPESIGFYYYDHGLVRVRRQVVDWYGHHYLKKDRVAIDNDILLDTEGKEFPIPAGYDIRAYSDGVILLEKGGKYGYMDYTGRWIAQPIYDYAEPFSEGLAVLGFGEDVRLMIDTDGETVIPAGAYRYISSASGGVIAACTHDGVWSILHKMARVEG